MSLFPRNNARRLNVDEPNSVGVTLSGEGDNVFAKDIQERHGRTKTARIVFVGFVILAVLYFCGMVLPKDVYMIISVNSRPSTTFFYTLAENVGNLVNLLTSNADQYYEDIPQQYAVVALAGAGLALSGAVYQGSFKNNLISPSTLGVMAGGQLGAMLWGILALDTTIFSTLGLLSVGEHGATQWTCDGILEIVFKLICSNAGRVLLAFLGCMIVVGLVLLTRKLSGGKASGIALIITGQVVAGVLSAIKTLVTYYYAVTDPYSDLSYYLQSLQICSFYQSYTWISTLVIFLACMLVFFVIYAMSSKMQVLALDEAEQRSMGINTKRIQTITVALCTLLTALIISFCGTIGFVGFLVPHIARRFVGPDFKRMLPVSMIIGAIFTMASFLVIDVGFGSTYAQLTGMVVSVIGTVVFLVTAIKGRGIANGSF